eukprot:TRINITY_DN31440_c0_g3_i1.p1 TRINITY_DN31440_c0_g3~~TRINITY_DN31440_c0_g3_i1.p1  ORF type:complete len:1149 (+),score=182.82 TRINITY_DN31440_c0_g3_i1:168-3614(+)
MAQTGGAATKTVKKPKEREPQDWEDHKFPKIKDRDVVSAIMDQQHLAKMRAAAKQKYQEKAQAQDPAKRVRTWRFAVTVVGLENSTSEPWYTFLAISETGPKHEVYYNRLHGGFQYSRSYRIEPGNKKNFGSAEDVLNKEVEYSYIELKNHALSVDVWQVQASGFNQLIGSAHKTLYDIANSPVHQTMTIKGNEGGKQLSFGIGTVYIQGLMNEIKQFDISLSNWQYQPRTELHDTKEDKKLKFMVPTGPKGSGEETFPTNACPGPVYTWGQGGMYSYKGTRASLANEVIIVTLMTSRGGQMQVQGKAIIPMEGAIDYPIAIGTVKSLTENVQAYVQGRVGGSITMTVRSLGLKKGQNDENPSIPAPIQLETSLTMYYLDGSMQYMIVEAHSAESLPIADPDYGSSNPFVRVKYDGCVQQSSVIMDSLTPSWNHTFYIPIRFVDPRVYSDPKYYKTIYSTEMQSKGFLELEIWHMDGVPTEYLGGVKMDPYQIQFGKEGHRSIAGTITKTRRGLNTDDSGEATHDDGKDAAGIDPALSIVHPTVIYEGRRETLLGSSLSMSAKPTINYEAYFLPKFPSSFKFPQQQNNDVGSESKLAASYNRWNKLFQELDDDYQKWFPDAPARRRWICQYTDSSGEVRPLPRLIVPLALPASLGEPLKVIHWIKCMEFNAPARQRSCGQINSWQTPSDTLALRRGSVQDHAVLLCCALQGLKKDAWVCIGQVQGGFEHAWVMTREAYGVVTFWETTTGAKFHMSGRWLAARGDPCIAQADARYKGRNCDEKWRDPQRLAERTDWSRQQHLAKMDDLVRLPIAPWRELYGSAKMICALPYDSIEVVFNGFGIYGNLLNHEPGSIFYDMEADKHSWQSLVGKDLSDQMFIDKPVVIQVGPTVSKHTAETLQKNIEDELKESIRMIRMRHGNETALEDSEILNESLDAYMAHLEEECRLDFDWAFNDKDQAVKPWGAPSPFNNPEYKSECREAWAKHWKKKKQLSDARVYLPVRENHVLSGVPLHFSSSDLKEIRKCIMGCKPIQEYFQYRSDAAYFFVGAKVFPLPSSVCSVWVFLGAEVALSKDQIYQIAKSRLAVEQGGVVNEETGEIEEAEDDDMEDLYANGGLEELEKLKQDLENSKKKKKKGKAKAKGRATNAG